MDWFIRERLFILYDNGGRGVHRIADQFLSFQRKAGRFYPTRLALNITNKNATVVNDEDTEQDKGHIIVETNYRVYAYTDSNLQVALLGLFTELLYRYVSRFQQGWIMLHL